MRSDAAGPGPGEGGTPGPRGLARPGSQPPRLRPRPPAEPRGTPSVTWRPPGSPWGLAPGSRGPPRVHAKEDPSRGLLWPRRGRHTGAFLFPLRPFPQSCSPSSVRGARFPGRRRPGCAPPASSRCPLPRKHRGKALQEKRRRASPSWPGAAH